MWNKLVLGGGMAAALGAGAYMLTATETIALFGGAADQAAEQTAPAERSFPMAPLPKYDEIRGIYITSSIAAHARMEEIIRNVKRAKGATAPNAIVIDVQDGAGKPAMNEAMRTLVRRLRFLGIFPIARVVAFQNDHAAAEHPAWAIKNAAGGLWRDRGGRYWLDPSNKEAWEYVLGVAEQAIEYGFGEINFDYFRFPSEGVKTAVYPTWREDAGKEKTDVIAEVARYLVDAIKTKHPDIAVTVDIFGYTFMRSYDLGIGQSAPRLAAIFDEVCPMIYPSHYDKGNFNYDNPAAHPYEVMLKTLEEGKEVFARANQPFTNIRPWIQDFDLGAVYTVDMVKRQMQAASDAGLTRGWLIWNPRNAYREGIFNE